MATSAVSDSASLKERLCVWRQGDYTLGLPQIVLATAIEDGDLVADVREVVGLVVITQTCDIVNCGGDKEWVTVAALREVHEDSMDNISNGSSPTFVSVECAPQDNVVADLNQMMTIHKSLLAQLDRKDGFKTDESRRRFADALSRKHGRFAFPDLFSTSVLSPLRTRVRRAHVKNSKYGAAYRSIDSARVVAFPSWDAITVTVGFRFLIKNAKESEANRSTISEIVSEHLGKINWPSGFSPAEPLFVLQTSEEMSAKEWLDSQEIDWQFISSSGA